MTGFGTGRALVDSDEIRVELRAVNHRFLDVRVRAQGPMSELGPAVEAILRAKLERGRVEAHLRLDRSVNNSLHLDLQRARAAFESLTALRDELQPDAEVPLSLLSSVPQLFRTDAPVAVDGLPAAVQAATEEACDELINMRLREGAALQQDLQERASEFRQHFSRICEHAPSIVNRRRERLRERITELLDKSDVSLDEGRLEHEVAVFAEKVDIAEEITRLNTHLDALDELLVESVHPVGRKLDFLLQEIGRETNTVGSKSPDAVMAATIIELKACLERMREQVQNVL